MATMEEQKEQQRAMWSASAPSWEKYVGFLETQLESLTNRLLDEAHVGKGTRVLDLACGSGEPSVSAAKRGANVLATDFSEEMIAVTRRRAAAAGVKMDVRLMDIENMDVPEAAFDAVTCRFGLMFCPNLQRAASQLHRAIKPGGYFALAVWDEPAKNPFFTAIGQLVQKYLNAPPPDPTAPGPLRLGAPGELDRVLRSGGFTNFKIEATPFAFTWDSPEAYWDMQSELAAPIKAAIAALPADQVAQLRGAVLDVAKAHIVDGKVRFAAQPLIAFGTR